MSIRSNTSWFSTILAILMTAFLTILSAGILRIFLVENSINHFLFDGVSSYMGAEWALEYALLKGTNHREGFNDAITSDDTESELLRLSDEFTNRKVRVSYTMDTFATTYSGVVNQGSFEIIPLFSDRGQLIQWSAKNPNKDSSNLIKTTNFLVTLQDGDLVWNIIANDNNGTTYGIVGTGSITQSFGDSTAAVNHIGFEKFHGTNNIMKAQSREISWFLWAYENAYLVLSNTSAAPVHYRITSPVGFSLPTRSIIASSSVGKSKQNIEFHEDRSRLFDILKYSLFNK